MGEGGGESRSETEADLIGLRLIPGNLENDSDCKLCGTARLRIACRNSKTGRLNHRCNLPEGGIAEVTVGLGEVCVIEDVVGFESHLDGSLVVFQDWEILVELEIGVVVSGTTEEVASNVSKGANRLRRKVRRVEVLVTGSTRVQFLDPEITQVRIVCASVVAKCIAPPRLIGTDLGNRDRKSSLQRGRTANMPASK